jgi:hypothetical protein
VIPRRVLIWINLLNLLILFGYTQSELSDRLRSPSPEILPKPLPSPPPPLPVSPHHEILSLSPPTPYMSRAVLFEVIQSWAKPRGYVFINGRSKITKMEGSGRTRVVFAYDREYKPPPSLGRSIQRIRNTQARDTAHLFSVLAARAPDKDTWELKHGLMLNLRLTAGGIGRDLSS